MKRFFSAFLAALLVSLPVRGLDAAQVADVPWASREAVARENGFVCVTDGETVNLDVLERWIAAYRGGIPSSVTVMTYGHPLFLVYTLTCGGGPEYAVTWHGGGLSGKYTARGVYARATDYVFGDAFPQGFKGPLSVPRMALAEAEAPATPPGGRVSPRDAASLAAKAETRVAEYVQRLQGVVSAVRLDDPRTAPAAGGAWEAAGTVSLAGIPCYRVTDASPGNWEGTVYAVSMDGAALFMQNRGFGGWVRLWDGAETLILPGSAGESWTRDVLSSEFI